MPQHILSLIIMGVIVFLFVTRLIPLSVTAMLGAAAMAGAGIITVGEVFASFYCDAVLLILGTIVLGNTLTETGCTDLIGNTIMRVPGIGKSERLFVIVTVSAVVFLSAFISNTATVAIFLPLVAGIAKTSAGTISKKNTYMAVGIASILGGNLTLAASTPQIVAQGILIQTEGCKPMGFFDLTKGAIPLILVMLIYFSTAGYPLQKKTFRFDESGVPDGGVEKARAGKRKAVIAGLIFLACVVGFVTEAASLGVVAILAACACMLTGCISVKRAAKTMDWTAIFVLGGSLGFSKGLARSGALQMMADSIIAMLGPAATPFMVLAALVVLTTFVGNFMSSTAAAAIVVPIAVTVAMGLGSNPTTFAVGVVIACSLSIATPVSTPPLTMTLAGGYRFSDYVVVGGALSILCMAVALTTLPLLYGL